MGHWQFLFAGTHIIARFRYLRLKTRWRDADNISGHLLRQVDVPMWKSRIEIDAVTFVQQMGFIRKFYREFTAQHDRT